ncbi:MAG: AMIN domain-containing protein [Desulfobulbus sp.]|jgi:hypothetical protein|uniref:AMIN domain-containing protein n=1 Tax=Desulfobulbus sp. TaxID=895 RepID=UPI0028438488|nr:AMIN domain-containing protein [Desulfobulbus sp.]MDR2550874.1 AMIN domain-containing protein [Desulfobulbus sp.]
MKKQFVALTLRSLFALLLACTLVSAEEATENAPAAPQLQNLKHLVLSPTSEEVILQLNGSYSPKVFTLKDENPRIIFDFDGMTYGRSVKSVTTTNGSIVKRVRVGMHAGNLSKTRIVFDVSTFKGLNFTQKFDASNSTLVVQFTGPGKAAAPRHQEKAAVPAPAKEAATAPVTTPGSAPEATAVPPEQAAAPQPPAQPEPSQPPAQPAPAPAKETAAAKQPQPEKAEVPAPAAKPATKESTKKERTKPEEKKDAPPEATTMKPEKVEAAGAEASPPPETTAALPVPALQAAAAPATAKSEEPEKKPEKPAKETAAQPAPENKKEKKAKAAAQAQEAAAAPAAAADKKAGGGAPDAGKSETADKPAILANATDKPQIEYVKFDDSSPKGEMVMFKLNGFHPPAIHGVEEGIPRVICDFSNTKLLQKSKGPIKTNGKFIKVIRTTTTKKPEKVRVVIDLEPNRSYDLQQVFFKEDNLFVLIVNTAKK